MLEIGSNVNFHKQLQVLFVIYTNFKTITQEVGSHDRDNDIDDKSYTNIFQKHLVCSYVYKVLEKDLERFKSLFRSFKDLENMNEKVLEEVEFSEVSRKRFKNKCHGKKIRNRFSKG